MVRIWGLEPRLGENSLCVSVDCDACRNQRNITSPSSVPAWGRSTKVECCIVENSDLPTAVKLGLPVNPWRAAACVLTGQVLFLRP